MQMRLVAFEMVWLFYYAFIEALSVHKLHQFCQVSECGQIEFCDFQLSL